LIFRWADARAAFVLTVVPMSLHAAVWIDHQEARIFHVEAERFDESTLHAPHHVARHPRSQTSDQHPPEEERKFYGEVAHALAGAHQVLVVGPSTAKLHFLNYVHKHDPALEPRIVGIETVDHPTDRQLAAYVRHYFVKTPLST
jgi:stalled ribosome rescue protein Dom34